MTQPPPVGAIPAADGSTRFCVWAPRSWHVEVVLEDTGRVEPLAAGPDGYFSAKVGECAAGARYRYRLDTGVLHPDPATRAQPDGVHGPSAVVDLGTFAWCHGAHRPQPLWAQVVYELHVGTFSPAGTFDGACPYLADLADLGVTAVELMPVAPFPGTRNWGYDGVFPFAVQQSYGGPAGLQRFVDACHGHGLDVVLDVVYNHLGPEGNVLEAYAPYFTDRYATPWGPAVNFDGPSSDDVRSYFLQNARQWFTDFQVDTLRLDAVHEIIDRSARPFLAELSTMVDDLSVRLGRPLHLIAESADNNPRVVSPRAEGGLGMSAQWNDDFHHSLHAALSGERTGYYVDFGSPADLARAMDQGFVFQGEHSSFRQRRYGAPSLGVAPERLVICNQNHDQVGNRPAGDRLTTLVDVPRARLAAAVTLLAPGVPLLFMGEEYGETAPFAYFVDHGDPALIEAVRTGRAHEFAELQGVAVPDPADPGTFAAAVLDRSVEGHHVHAERRALYRALLAGRRANPALGRSARHQVQAHAEGPAVTLLRTHWRDSVVAFFNLSDAPAPVALPWPPPGAARGPDGPGWVMLLDGADPGLGGDGDLLPALGVPGQAVLLAPWGFCAYHLAPVDDA
jgi:maltooligosyltrehalose trehalohydrolase